MVAFNLGLLGLGTAVERIRQPTNGNEMRNECKRVVSVGMLLLAWYLSSCTKVK